jgi:hypothetical protein
MINSLGWHTPWAPFFTVFMSLGAGLLMTLQVDAELSEWFGYQVMHGSTASGFQQLVVAVRSVLKLEDFLWERRLSSLFNSSVELYLPMLVPTISTTSWSQT